MKVRQLLENKASQYLYEDYYNSYKNELVNIMKNLKRNNKKIVLINNLSAIGSANFPKVVINFDFLAICPSK